MQTGDYALVKQLNKAIVLGVVRHSSPISRARVSQTTGLNKSTVSSIIAELIAEGLVVEIGAGRSTGGRRPVLLSFNARAGTVVGIELGVTFMRGILCDLLGQPIEIEQIPLRTTQVGDVVATLTEFARKLIKIAPPTPVGVLGVGVGVPGTVDADQGTILLAPNLGWRDVSVGPRLRTALGVPVYLENEANAAALGEQWFGIASHSTNLVYISVGMGIGAGILLKGVLYRGSHGVAGEVGHMTMEAAGSVCSCGNRGCWELYASEKALRKWLPERADQELDMILNAADQGDPQVIAALHQVGENLGIGLASLLNSFDPDLVVIGGPLLRAHRWLLGPVEESLRARVMYGPAAKVPLMVSRLGLNACALGAASVVLDQHFRLPSLDLSPLPSGRS